MTNLVIRHQRGAMCPLRAGIARGGSERLAELGRPAVVARSDDEWRTAAVVVRGLAPHRHDHDAPRSRATDAYP
jgi:hypothetical protein